MRTIPAALITALEQQSVDLYFAVELLFDTSPLRIWSGIGETVIGGNTYTGTGSLLSITTAEESNDLAANGASITLSGVDSGIIALALTEPYQSRICKIYIGSGENVLEVFSGYMDVMTFDDGGDTCTITLTVESRLITMDRAVSLRYTQESQAARYPTDTFFSYVADLADKSITWGRASSGSTSPSTTKKTIPVNWWKG